MPTISAPMIVASSPTLIVSLPSVTAFNTISPAPLMVNVSTTLVLTVSSSTSIEPMSSEPPPRPVNSRSSVYTVVPAPILLAALINPPETISSSLRSPVTSRSPFTSKLWKNVDTPVEKLVPNTDVLETPSVLKVASEPRVATPTPLISISPVALMSSMFNVVPAPISKLISFTVVIPFTLRLPTTSISTSIATSPWKVIPPPTTTSLATNNVSPIATEPPMITSVDVSNTPVMVVIPPTSRLFSM